MIYKIVCAGENHFKNLYIKDEEEVIIGVDCGLTVLKNMNVDISYFFGDCDSLNNSDKDLLKYIPSNLYKAEKDQTDLELALDFVIENYKVNDKIIIYNATGKRLDHYEGALRLLKKFCDYDIELVDDLNHISVYKKSQEKYYFKKNEFKYISFFNIYPDTIITLVGFKYPLDHYLMKENDCLCISNQIEEEGYMLVNNDILVIKSK